MTSVREQVSPKCPLNTPATCSCMSCWITRTKGVGIHVEPIVKLAPCIFAEYLNQNADMFQRTATRLKRKLWWQNVKLWIILIIIILVILAVIISEWRVRNISL